MKHIIILGDGMADLPVERLGGKTLLQYAHKPVMDLLAKEGRCGRLMTVPDGFPPGSEVANTSILGYDLVRVYEGRGPLEAASIGVNLAEDDLALRCNLVCLEGELLKNHSCGRLETEEGDVLIRFLQENLGSDKVHFYTGVQYRHLLVIKGGNKDLRCTPPHDIPLTPLPSVFPSVLLEVATQGGTRFFQQEYVREDRNVKWHGFITIIRKGVFVYRLMREIPDDAWLNGKHLLGSYANLALYRSFLADRWESPGVDQMLVDADFDSLAESIKGDLNKERISDWHRIGKKVDTLMYLSYSGGSEQRKIAKKLLSQYRRSKANSYNEFRNQYDIGKRERNEAKMREAFEACRGAFGNDPTDLRSIKVNDPEEWSCRRDA